MLNKLKILLNLDESNNQNQTDSDLNLITAALMIEVAKADDSIDQIELDTLKQFLKKDGLSSAQIDELIEQASVESEDATSLQGFTRTLCENWNNEQRFSLLVRLWGIAIADDNIDTYERHIIRKIAALLYLNEKQIISATKNKSSLQKFKPKLKSNHNPQKNNKEKCKPITASRVWAAMTKKWHLYCYNLISLLYVVIRSQIRQMTELLDIN